MGVALAGLLWLALAAAAGAEPVSGAGLVTAKDLVGRTITLDTGMVLLVNDETKLLDPSGGRMELEQLAVAPAFGGGFVVTGEAHVRFKGRHQGDRVVARSVEVLGQRVQ
jgi:hypothetical protein